MEKSNKQQNVLLVLRIIFGWYFLYAGATKVFNPEWSAVGYLSHAKTFPGLFEWFAQPSILPVINFLNQWGITLVGIALLLGVAIRFSSYVGVLLMALYYFPVLEFPYVPPHAFIVDEHIIYIVAFLILATFAGEGKWRLGNTLANSSLFARFPKIANFLKH